MNKRDFLEVMDVDEEDTSRMPKKLKTEKSRNLLHITKAKGIRKTVKSKGTDFEVQEYPFDSVPEGVVK